MKIDERALEAAAMALYAYQRESSPESLARMQPWSDADEMGWQAVAEQDARTAITAYLAACPTPDAEAMEREFGEVLNRHDGNVTTLTVTRIVSKSDEEAERLAAGSKQELIDLYRKAVSR